MALEIYKRRHGCDIEKRVDKGEVRVPQKITAFTFLQQWPHCDCAWWVRGVTDQGRVIVPRSLKVYSKRAAEEEVAKLNAPKATGKPNVSIANAVEDWLTELTVGETNPRTLESYRNGIGKLTAFCKMKKVTWLVDVEPRLINQLRAEWAVLKRAKATRLNYLAVIGVFFNWAVRQDIIPSSPLKKIAGLSKVNDVAKREKTLPLDPKGGDENYRKFLDAVHPFLACGNKRVRRGGLSTRPDNFVALCELMYETGLRVSDAVEFQPEKLVFGERCATCRFRQKKTRNTEEGGWVTVFLPLWLAVKLQKLPRISEGYPFLDVAALDPQEMDAHDYICHEVNDKMRQIAKSAGLTGIRPHRFRDSFAVRMLNEGYGFDEVAILLGHQNPKTTMKYYSPWVESREKAMADRLFPAKPRKVVEIKRAG